MSRPVTTDGALRGHKVAFRSGFDRGFGLATIRAGLQSLATDGALRHEDAEALALLLYGALTEASLALGAGLTTVDEDAIIETAKRILRAFAPAPR
jgi:hypothetical protein